MKDLRAIAVLILYLGLLVGNIYAQDEQVLGAFADASAAFDDVSSYAAATGVPTGSIDAAFEAADAGYPTAASSYAAAAGVTNRFCCCF